MIGGVLESSGSVSVAVVFKLSSVTLISKASSEMISSAGSSMRILVDFSACGCSRVFLGAGFSSVVLTGILVLAGLIVFAAVFFAARVERPSIDLFVFIIYNYNIMAIKLTKKQLAVLDFLQDFTEEKGYSPSYREIQAGLGLSSVSAVAEHIDNLVEKGVLKKVPGAARSLEILDYKHEETVQLFQAKMVSCSEEEKKVLERAAEILGLDLA